MQTSGLGLLDRDARRRWVRLYTLILLRWMAVTGQAAALLVAYFHFGLRFDLGLCLLLVTVSAGVNLVAMGLYSENRRLSENGALMTLLFDISQLAALLYLTGGLNNPFALLILAPVTISATALSLRTTVLLGGVAIAAVSLLALFHQPLLRESGEILRIPPLLAFGFWGAIVIGVVFIGLYLRRVATEIHSMSEALLATQMALAREQKLTDLGGVVAAAAHELGTPLATIKLVSTELANELAGQPELESDALLIRDQADRCRDILRSMGRAGKDDRLMRSAPVSDVLREAAEPHMDRGRNIRISVAPHPGSDRREPVIQRHPEIIHGLRNLIQNAVDFARSEVRVSALWTSVSLSVRIEDDGPGFSQHILGRIGEPFVRSRRSAEPGRTRPGYEGMGLGLFIAKTLLERTGAELTFANARESESAGEGLPGAVVELSWPLSRILESGGPLGENAPFTG